jgi:hypothetical protein
MKRGLTGRVSFFFLSKFVIAGIGTVDDDIKILG